ncbi:MAG TPA: hypothetical protein DCY13_01745 [Verrucomicrobiales bacterium]|nr:hypothetical protein [Verrucomicrobiales bacterium]
MPASIHLLQRIGPGRAVLIVLLGLAALVVAIFVTARLTARAEVNRRLAELRTAGYPVTLTELDQSYLPDSPEARDRGRELVKVLQTVQERHRQQAGELGGRLSPLPVLGEGILPPPGTPLDNEVRQLAVEPLQQLEPALQELRTLLAADPLLVRFPVNFTNGIITLLPHLSPIRNAQQWLLVRSIVATDERRADEMADTLTDMLRLSRSLQHEPALISQLVRVALLDMARGGIERSLASGQLQPNHLAALRTELQLANPTNTFHLAMSAERCCGLSILWDADNPFIGLNGGTPLTSGQIAFNLIYRMTGLREQETLFYLDHLGRAVAAGTNSIPERLRIANELMAVKSSRWRVLTGMLMPALSRPFAKEADTIAQTDALVAALAVTEFHERQGRWPNGMAELVPDYFDSPPVDPRNDTPLKVVATPNGFRVDGKSPLLTIDFPAQGSP